MADMDLKTIIEIPMEKYGAEGVVKVAAPTLRRTIEMRNRLGRLTKMRLTADDNRSAEVTVDDGYQYIITTLVYVREAPFPLDTEGFLRYCDRLDAKANGSGQALLEDIHSAALAIDSGDASPFVASLRQGSGSSE